MKVVLSVILIFLVFGCASERTVPTTTTTTQVESPPTPQTLNPARVFYTESDVAFEHYWPISSLVTKLTQNESEILIYNFNDIPITIQRTSIRFYSGHSSFDPVGSSWKRFVTPQSQDPADTISEYMGDSFILGPGEMGAIRYAYDFTKGDFDLSDQRVDVKITYTVGTNTDSISTEVSRFGL